MSKHTPGPWKYWHEKGYVGELNSPTGSLIAGFESEPSEADARLIAAAPDLLAALQAMLGCCYDMERNDETLAAVKGAMKAIYNATGEQP